MTKFELMVSMNNIVRVMNDENAYMRWIVFVPDGASNDDLFDIAEDDEDFRECCEVFAEIMKDHIKYGLYIDDLK